MKLTYLLCMLCTASILTSCGSHSSLSYVSNDMSDRLGVQSTALAVKHSEDLDTYLLDSEDTRYTADYAEKVYEGDTYIDMVELQDIRSTADWLFKVTSYFVQSYPEQTEDGIVLHLILHENSVQYLTVEEWNWCLDRLREKLPNTVKTVSVHVASIDNYTVIYDLLENMCGLPEEKESVLGYCNSSPTFIFDLNDLEVDGKTDEFVNLFNHKE